MPEEFTQAHPEVPWRQIIGMRHRIVHDYFDVDPALVFDIARNEVPLLGGILRRLVLDLDPGA